MKIPIKFDEILIRSQRLSGLVYTTISVYDDILKENKLYFFEEYTDHGIRHVESVLNSTIQIIPEETFTNLLVKDPESISIYILATVLHDIGMHITPEGFHSLISGDFDDIRVKEFDKETWKELWETYLDEARKWGDIEKKNIIGNKFWRFEKPDTSRKDKLNGEHKKLIGEFIRRYHPRLAHEIALKGFPTKEEQIPFAERMEPAKTNICGLIARSHGLNIRNTFDYLKGKFGHTWIKPYNIEVVYLMVLLRTADYFQFDSSRTPVHSIKLKTFNSPISQTEHYKHLDVKYIQTFKKDPETLFAHCEPRNSFIFISLKKLLADIQYELDLSWAILGEIYGKETKKEQPGLIYRRIKSNLDDVKSFAKTVNYIPESIGFNVSNEISKLLVGPLYGNDPSFGIRELVQNATDACREREYLEGDNYSGSVTVTLFSKNESNSMFFSIEDNGIGMDINVLKNYFLKIGSSLRNSSQWRKQYSDDVGNSKIQRSGKFGIGVLAAFLIGDEMQIETRHKNAKYGLSFETNLNTDHIEIQKKENIAIGTKITIPISQKTINHLYTSEYPFYRWYCLNTPKVIFINKTKTILDIEKKTLLPGINETLDYNWREISHNDYSRIIWTYDQKFNNEYGESLFYLNGILVPYQQSFSPNPYFNGNEYLYDANNYLPTISVHDFDGNLPLNLNRIGLISNNIPFIHELLKEIAKDALARILTMEVIPPWVKTISSHRYKPNHRTLLGIELLFSNDGFIINHETFIKNNAEKSILQFSPSNIFPTLEDSPPESFFYQIHPSSNLTMSDISRNIRLTNFNKGAKQFLSREMYNKLFDSSKNRISGIVKKNHQVENINDSNIEISYNYSPSRTSLKNIEKYLEYCNYILEMKLADLAPFHAGAIENDLYTQLYTYFDKPNIVIPYDIKKRKKMFKSVFEELKYYIEKYELEDKAEKPTREYNGVIKLPKRLH